MRMTSPAVIRFLRTRRLLTVGRVRMPWGIAALGTAERMGARTMRERFRPALHAVLLRRLGATHIVVRGGTRSTLVVNPIVQVGTLLSRSIVRPVLERVHERERHATRFVETTLRSVERHVHAIERVVQALPLREAPRDARPDAGSPGMIVQRAPAAPAPVRPPVPMVLRRAAAAPPAPREARSAEMREIEAPVRLPMRGAAVASGATPAFSPAQMSRLADEVMRSIDRRLVSQRERLGRR